MHPPKGQDRCNPPTNDSLKALTLVVNQVESTSLSMLWFQMTTCSTPTRGHVGPLFNKGTEIELKGTDHFLTTEF